MSLTSARSTISRLLSHRRSAHGACAIPILSRPSSRIQHPVSTSSSTPLPDTTTLRLTWPVALQLLHRLSPLSFSLNHPHPPSPAAENWKTTGTARMYSIPSHLRLSSGVPYTSSAAFLLHPSILPFTPTLSRVRPSPRTYLHIFKN
ncbi:hypothetical protein MVEN_02306900 [Mycena venus]|uniref:Uncharacterized protein n=1 Tax=Mycena venus TaxID=2733690 RepID=A0A8H7CFG6_9AGAR|nr:hypothetical protein MVEN_02306900 [Mycena venus]